MQHAKCHKEIKIAFGKDTFSKRQELQRRKMNKTLKKQMIKTLIWCVVLYRSKTWTMKEGHQAIGILQNVDLVEEGQN